MSEYDKLHFRKYMRSAETDKAIQTLKGIFDGILIDGKIDHDEIMELKNWAIVNDWLCEYKPFDELIVTIDAAIADDILTDDEILDIQWVLDKFSEGGDYYNLTTLQIQRLEGICHGILADNKVTSDEILALDRWLSDNDFLLKGTFPYEELRSLICSILADGIIEEDEKLKLKAFLSEFVDCSTSLNLNEVELKELSDLYSLDGICATNPDIVIQEHLFCFTGKSSRKTRAEIGQIILEHGGQFKPNVLKNTDYLIVGDEGNPCWAYSCYGRKVEAAEKLRREGKPIMIVHENDFWKSLL